MTLPQTSATVRKKSAPLSMGQLCFGFFALFCLLLILRNSEIAMEYMSRGLLLCTRTVIPSLFPFMILSEIIVSGGLVKRLPRWLSASLRSLFGLSDAGCCAVLLGMLCGFPVGAKCAKLSYEQGIITQEEGTRILTFSNNPSSAFLIGAVGASLWGNRRFGIALYATVLSVAAVTGILVNRLQKKDTNDDFVSSAESLPLRPLTGAKLFTESVRSATGSMLLICAYVVFFSALMGAFHVILAAFDLPQGVTATLFCLLELSGGVSQASALADPIFSAVLCAFAAGWSGLSVHCQLISVCDGTGFSFRVYFLAKLFQGLLCALVFGILVYLFPNLTVPAEICGK